MQYRFQIFSSRNRHKSKREKNPIKLKYIIACIKTVIIYVKKPEIFWFVKTTFNITFRPCSRCITVLLHKYKFTFYYTQG